METPSSFSIREAAERTGLSAHTLRWYERIGLIDSVERDEYGYRVYSEELLVWLQFLHVLRSTGMGIEQMKAFVELARKGEVKQDEQLSLLVEHRQALTEQIQDLQGFLVAIDKKIDEFQGKKQSA